MKPSDFLLHTDKFASNSFKEQRKKALKEENSTLLKNREKNYSNS